MKKLFLLLSVCLLAFAACEPTNSKTDVKTDANAELTLTSEEILNFDAAGGSGTITYTLENVKEGTLPTAKSGAEWVTDITVAETITFNVAANNTTEDRNAVILVEYGAKNFSVHVKQQGDPYADWVVDVEFEATALNGEYYGTKYSQDPNYFAILSKNGTTGWSDLYVDTYYRFDIYSKTPTDESAPVLPLGTYTYDSQNSSLGNTFGDFYSVRIETFKSGQLQETKIQDGFITITENKFVALLKLVDGTVHRVVYEGSLALGYIEVPAPDYYSTLTEDYTFNHPDGVIRLNYFGDYYGIGAANWTASLVLPGTNINGDYFMIDIVTNSDAFDASNIVGTYNCVEEANVAKNTFIAGYYNEGFASSWYFVAVDNYYGTDDRAPIVDGTITISQDGIKFIVEFDCMDDNGHKIKGTYACSGLEMYDNTQN